MKNANPVYLLPAWMASVALVLLAAGCGGDKGPDASAGQKTIFDHFAISVGGHPASLQLAVLESEQQRGLMQRPDLGPDEGMIFVDARPHQLSFWMHNTPEPLDLAYATADGVVVETYDLLPFDERIVYSHRSDLQIGLEMPKGWFAANGVRAGSQIDMAAVRAALKDRGFDPGKLGLP